MNWKKVKVFLQFHWIGIIITILVLVLAVSFAFFLNSTITAWKTSESYFKKATLAQYGIFFYIFLVLQVISLPLSGALWIWMMRGGYSKFSKINAKSMEGKDIKIHWADVIGMDEAKQEASEVVKLVMDRVEVQKIGGKILRGILMMGPPGCGKTYLAKAIATESNLPFMSMSGSEFIEMFVGVGASRIRKLFKQARQLAYTDGGCIIFIDELDAVGAQRSVDRGFGGQTESNTTLNQLLIEMDGLKEKDYNVIIIGATNAPETFLDPAILRPGRFDRKIYVELPNLEEREKLFEYYLKDAKYDSSVDKKRLARLTVGNSPADVANLVHEAALIAVRNKKQVISMKEITEAYDRVEMGIKHKVVFSQEERVKIAYHEAGHALVAHNLPNVDPVRKISIVARGSMGGYTRLLTEDRYFMTASQFKDTLATLLAGHAAEEMIFNEISTGPHSDIKQATALARRMVTDFGMSKKLGLRTYGNQAVSGYLGFGPPEQKDYGEEVARQIDEEVYKIMEAAHQAAKKVLAENRPRLTHLAEKLLAKEILEGAELEAAFTEPLSAADSAPLPQKVS